MGSKQYVVPYTHQGSLYGDEEIAAVANTLLHADTLECGPERDLFETEFADFIGTKYALSTPSCTMALHFAAHLLNLRPGDEVIATPFTYQASVNALLVSPAEVRFCDVDPNTLCIAPASLERLINDRTRAICLTHYGGFMADMDAVMELARSRGVTVVEDSAHALGSEYKGRRPGTQGDISCFSFNSMKNISTLGQGGMITFDDDVWAGVANNLRSVEPDADFIPRRENSLGPHPMPTDDVYRHEKNAYTHDCTNIRHCGTNGTLSEPAAAVGRVQLRKLDALVERRRQIAATLDRGLSDIPGIRLQVEPEQQKSSRHLYCFFVEPDSGLDRDRLAAAIEDEGVNVVLRYFPIHLLPEWRSHGRGHGLGECPVAEKVWFEQLVNLPCYPLLTDAQVDCMVAAVRRAVARVRN